jgi:hypothetical protein
MSFYNNKIGWVVAHTCNLRYSGGGDHEDCSSMPVEQKVSEDPFWKDKLYMVAHTWNRSYTGGIDRKIMAWGQPWAKGRPYLKKITKA